MLVIISMTLMFPVMELWGQSSKVGVTAIIGMHIPKFWILKQKVKFVNRVVIEKKNKNNNTGL